MKRDRGRRALEYAAGFVLFVAVWWGGSGLVGAAILPPPWAIARYIASPGLLAAFARDTILTISRGALGFLAAWLVAVPSGILMGRRRRAERVGFFPLFLLQSAPPLFWVTPLVLWLGTRGQVAPAVAFLVSLPLLTVHTLTAIKHIPTYEYDLFSVYAPRTWVMITELYLPRLLPAVKSNVHLGLLVAIKAAMLAEWFTAQDGFGRTIRVHYQFFAMTEFLSWALLFLVVVGGLSLALHAVLERILPQYRHTEAQPTAHGGDGAGPESARISHPMAAPALVVRDLAFGYGRSALFSGVSLEVHARRPLVLYGRSGCGKTTLLRCIAGLLEPWNGEVLRPSPIGFVFQEDALLDHRDALGNVLLANMPRPDIHEIASAHDSLELWGLGDKVSAFPHELSGGMRKRLAVARAWNLGTGAMLLDEPFVNLDREARVALWELLFRRLAERDMAALVVTHYPEELAGFDVELRSWDSLMNGT